MELCILNIYFENDRFTLYQIIQPILPEKSALLEQKARGKFLEDLIIISASKKLVKSGHLLRVFVDAL
jgi:hypothetical protein